jgi:hypothetical protein
MTIGLIAGCGEPKQLASSSATTPPSATETAPPEAPPTSSAPPAAESSTVPAEPTPPAAAQAEPPKNLAPRKLAAKRLIERIVQVVTDRTVKLRQVGVLRDRMAGILRRHWMAALTPGITRRKRWKK